MTKTMEAHQVESPLARFSDAELEQLAKEFDAIHDEVYDDLGEDDAKYIRGVIEFHRRLVVLSRLVLMASRYKPAWVLGTAGLSVAKILENMEIGHNVMHGQWDWMNDPEINATVWEWDSVCPSDQWKHGHNLVHHTWTNVRGMDRDIGYEILRTTSATPWHPAYLAQPVYNALLGLLFEWGVGVHEIDFRKLPGATAEERATQLELFRGFVRKAGRQVAKDYVLWPALAGPGFVDVAAADAVANIIRNVWSYVIIFCGHFPDGVHVFERDVIENETRADWYVRQILGSANISGGPRFHVLAGNLSHQIEHHLFPDMPSRRYQQIAPRVRALCARYELPYNSGPLWRQFAATTRKIWRYALPGGRDTTTHVPKWAAGRNL